MSLNTMFNIIALSWSFRVLCKCIDMLTFTINKLLHVISVSPYNNPLYYYSFSFTGEVTKAQGGDWVNRARI